MSKLFNNNMLEYNHTLKNWREVVFRGVELLAENGYATVKLADAIFESTSTYGAYYVLEEGLCLLHAKPGSYILKNGASTIILEDLIEFNNQKDKRAKIVITLAAKDSSSHIELIQEFAHYFTNENFKKSLYKVKTIQEFKKLVEEFK